MADNTEDTKLNENATDEANAENAVANQETDLEQTENTNEELDALLEDEDNDEDDNEEQDNNDEELLDEDSLDNLIGEPQDVNEEEIDNVVEAVSNNGRGIRSNNKKSNYSNNSNDNFSNENSRSSVNTNYRKSISKATEKGVKKSITELIEDVKNQVVAEQQAKDYRNSISSVVGSKTIEQFLYDLIQPKIVEYLDMHLEDMVQGVVESEIKKIVHDTKKQSK